MPSKPTSHERNIVEWQFVFTALWSLCGQSRTKLTIPQTLLIRNGCAYKWLASDSSGCLIRKQVGPLFIPPCSSTSQRGRSRSSHSASSLVVRKQLLDCVDSFGSGSHSGNSNTCSCIVCWYRDGRYEYITRQELFKMASSNRWRLQLVGIQDCCGCDHRRLTRVVGRIDRNGANDTITSTGSSSRTAADILASSIASCVERSYFDRCDDGRLVVVGLVADFIMDGNKKLWFSHAKRLVVRYSTIGASALVARGGSLEVEVEAQNAGERLRSALLLALQRKVGVQNCFRHFDVKNVGYCGAGGLQDGLSRLGLEISDGASGMLMCWIARADGMHFCSNDLVDFALRSELRLGDNSNACCERSQDLEDQKCDSSDGASSDGACVPFEVDLDNHLLPNDTNTEESNVGTNTDTGTTTCRDEMSGVTTTFLVGDDKTERGLNANGADARASSTDDNDTPDHENSNGSRADSADESRDKSADIATRTSSTPPGGEDNAEINPSDFAPPVPPLAHAIETGATSSSSSFLSSSLSSSSPTSTETQTPQTSLPLSSPTNNGRRESAAGLHRAEIHLMRQEDKLSLDAFRIDPNNFAAFQEAAKQGRERARALRSLAKEEVILEKMLDSGRRRAIKREQRRVAGANAKESAARSELIALKGKMERFKESLRLEQEEINNSKSNLLVDKILFDISTSGQALRDIGYKQHQAQIRATEYTYEVQSSETLVNQLQEGLTAVCASTGSTGTPGTGNFFIATLPSATQELRIRLQRAKDKLERAVEQLDHTKNQLQRCNESVRASAVVFRQKQRVGKDLLTWVEAEAEQCRADIVQLRQQREDLGNETILLREKSDVCERRIDAIKSEIKRFNNNTSGATSTSRSGTGSRRQQQGKDQNFGRQGQRWCIYVDTSLWHDDGLLQRMETKEFMRIVEEERSTLERDLAVHRFRGEEIELELDHIKQLLSTNSILSANLNSIRSRLCGNPFIALPALPAANAENNRSDMPSPLKREEILSPSSLGETDLASRIRGTRHDILTAEEKEWVCLDYSINPHLYECNHDGSSPLIVDPMIIHRLLNLPEQIQLALPYLTSTEEIRAHFLINKYTLGRGEEYFQEYDTAKSRNGGDSLATTNGEGGPTTQSPTFTGIINNHRDLTEYYAVDLGVTSTFLLDALAKDDKRTTTSRSSDDYHDIATTMLPISVAMGHRQNKTTGDVNEDGNKMDTGALSPCVYESLEELIEAHAIDESITQPHNMNTHFISSNVSFETLLDVPTRNIAQGDRQVHRFVIEPSWLHVIQSMTITVVFQGTFASTGYCPGRISVSLARRHCCGHATLASTSSCPPFIPVGYSLHEEQAINTKASMGRIVIRHSDGAGAASSPVMPAHYEILVAAESDARYSISIDGTICPNAQLHLQEELATYLRKRHTIQQCEADAASLFNDMRLTERQLTLLDKLRQEANIELERCRKDIEQCDLILAKYTGESDYNGCGGSCGVYDANESESKVDQLYRDIKVLEIEYSQLSFRMAGRDRQRAEIRSGLESMARLRHKVQQKAVDLKQNIAPKRKIIPLATSALFGTKLGADVANLCDSYFDLEHIIPVADTGEVPSSAVIANGSSSAEKIAQLCNTPAETVRRLARRDATPRLSNLTLEERKFCLLDRVLHPSKWDWLDCDDDDANIASTMAASAEGSTSTEGAAQFVIPTATEILRIKSTPIDQLRRKAEKDVKHLLLKYHDGSASSSGKGAKPNRGALAAKTRAKSARLYSKADHEWQSIDIVLNPAEWNWRYGGRKPSRQRASGVWTCPFTRDEILTIWQSTSIPSSGSINNHLIDEDSRRTHDLLLQYNGAFEDFCQGTAAAAACERSAACRSDDSNGSSGNIDDRCHLIQAELDRALFCQDDFLVSSILNGTPQCFPTQILRLELERELDRLFIDQILLREQEDQMQPGDGAGSTCSATKKEAIAQIVNEDATNSNVVTRQGKARGVGLGEAFQEQEDNRSHEDDILFQRRRSDRNTNATKERQKELDRTVRFGLLLLVFGYFRSQYLAKERGSKLCGTTIEDETQSRNES